MRSRPVVPALLLTSSLALGAVLVACRGPSSAPATPQQGGPATPRQSLSPVADTLAPGVVPPGWTLDSPPTLVPFTRAGAPSSWLLVADSTLDLPNEGVRRRVRRFALVTARAASGWRVTQVTTVELSVGGTDPWTDERRDIDGDGVPDLLVHYARYARDQEPNLGFVAVTSGSERLLQMPLVHVLGAGHAFSGDACWLSVRGRPVLLVDWREYGPDLPTFSTTAYVVDAQGFEGVPLFGMVAAKADSAEVLQRPLGLESAGEQAFGAPVADCPMRPAGAAIVTTTGGFSIVSGWSFSRSDAGATWPSGLAKPADPGRFETAPGQPFAWPAVD